MRVIIVLALVGAAVALPSSRIVGGTVTTIQEHPYMVNMQFSFLGMPTGFGQICGGTLVTERAVVSAAHCYDRWAIPEWYRACLGTSFRSVCNQPFDIANILFHPRYNRETLNNDIVMLRFRFVAQQSQNIKPARIAGPNYNLADGTPVTTIGWGDTSYNGRPSEQLQHVVVNIINQQLCADRYAYLKSLPDNERTPDVTESMICAGILDVGGKDGCQGDSGGPVIHGGDVLIGVTSWGYECAHSFYPGVLVRVSQFSDWIEANS